MVVLRQLQKAFCGGFFGCNFAEIQKDWVFPGNTFYPFAWTAVFWTAVFFADTFFLHQTIAVGVPREHLKKYS